MSVALNTAVTPKYEVVDPRFRSYVLANATLEPLVEGCRWLEGPVWFADHRLVIVSDIPNDRVLRVTESGDVSVFQQPAGYANGHARDRQDRLISCLHLHRCITRAELDGGVVTLVDRYQGKRLNSPNDVIVKRDGTIWFTDPHYGIETNYEGEKQQPELPPSVYCFNPQDGILTLVADDFEGANGLCFSPDEKLLYVSESGRQFTAQPTRYIRVFDVVDGPVPLLRNSRIFHSVTPGYADGIRCDTEGNVWSSAGDGVHCIHPSGTLLGKILLPTAISNLCFGGRKNSRLFLCAGSTLYALTINCCGSIVP